MGQGLFLVDKERSQQRKIKAALKQGPAVYRIYEAETLRQELRILSEQKIDLIIYDDSHPPHRIAK